MHTKKIALAFAIFLLIFAIAQFMSPNIIGFDGYYHIKAAGIVKENGLIKEFPWAKHTILSENYADIQFLFRLLQIPFIAFFGLALGAKISAALFAAIAFTIFYWFLHNSKIKFPLFWSLLYVFTSVELMYRFLLGRQMPLAISLIILTVYFLQEKKYFLLGLASLIFVWLYSGFVIQLFIIFAYFLIEKIFTKKFDCKIIFYPFFGAIAGLIINPYFPNNLSMLYIQIFKVNLLSNLYNVEWKPWPFLEFIKNNIIALFYFALSVFIIIKNKKLLEQSSVLEHSSASRKETSPMWMAKMQAYFLSLAVFFFAYTILSRRMQEYFIPFAILASAFIANDYFQSLEKSEKKKLLKTLRINGIILIIIIGSVSFVLLKRDYIKTEFFHNYNGCAEWMKGNIPKGSLVFTNAYAFPYLFFKNSDVIYTHGIDLAYSYLHNPVKFERYIGILQGNLKGKTDFILEDYAPDYVFSGKLKQDVQLFKYIVAHKENYKAVYEDEWCAVLKVGKKEN